MSYKKFLLFIAPMIALLAACNSKLPAPAPAAAAATGSATTASSVTSAASESSFFCDQRFFRDRRCYLCDRRRRCGRHDLPCRDPQPDKGPAHVDDDPAGPAPPVSNGRSVCQGQRLCKSDVCRCGQPGKKGQLLAVLEAPELQAQTEESASLLHTQEAALSASQATYDRLYKTSRIPGTVSPNELELARAKASSDSASLAAARSHYLAADWQSYLQVRAPFDGVISSRNIYPGAYAGPAGKGSSIPLMTLQQQRRLRLVVDVPEAATAYFRDKDTIHFSVQTLPGRVFTATVTRMAGALDLQSRTEQLQMDVVNDSGLLLPGMFAQVSLDLTNNDQQFIVPVAAVTGNSDHIFVIRVRDGATQWVTVQKGREANGKVEIYGDLQAGDRLVAAATDELKEGTIVRTN
ncbi:efflux RND transporter periplasmic adaptor subunit [Puia sp. P3]|uniref:efflux RND transporter periplasmic adaptor subunit n=1 Tax=Puia sp. P3 TaxID=3423952 RepID=UPI003D67DC30